MQTEPYLRRAAPAGVFALGALALVLLGAWCALRLHPGSVWEDHLQAGRLLLVGQVPANPTYPIWGYSLAAGAFGPALLWIQAALGVAAATAWFVWAVRPVHGAQSGVGAPPISPARAAACALLMAPWFAVVASYFSNSLPSILALIGTGLLWMAAQRPPSWTPVVAAGLLFGLAANMRTEYQLIGLLLGGVLLVFNQGARRLSLGLRLLRGGMFFAVVLASMIPWALYTKATVGQYRLSASNSGASAYLGLAQLPNNPWGVVLQDDFVDRIAREKVGVRSAPMLAADDYLKQAFVEAVKAHPGAFAQRVLYGWRTMLMQGLYIPNLRQVLASDANDERLLSLAAESIKQRLHLNVNWYKVQEQQGLGLSLTDLRARHYLMLGLETLIRVAYAGVFVGLLAALAWRLLRRRPLGFAGMAALAYLAHLFFVSGFIQTSPRHTTLVLPLLLAAVVLAPRSSRPDQILRSSSQNRSSAG